MPTSMRSLAVASLLLVFTLPGAGVAAIVPDTLALEFLGFRAGARLEDLALHLRVTGGGKLRCRQSKVDRRVRECRAALNGQQLAGAVELWVSAMDSLAGVITVSGVLAPAQLEGWREALETRYGRVRVRAQGGQSMLQWVRRGRMLRLTWRLERGEKVASVSLVDGRVLDDWGRAAAPVTAGAPTQPASRIR